MVLAKACYHRARQNHRFGHHQSGGAGFGDLKLGSVSLGRVSLGPNPTLRLIQQQGTLAHTPLAAAQQQAVQVGKVALLWRG